MTEAERELQDLKLVFEKDKVQTASYLMQNAKAIGQLTKDVKDIVSALGVSQEALSSLKSIHKRVDKLEEMLEDYLIIKSRSTMIFKGFIWFFTLSLGAIILGLIGANIDFK